MTVRIYTTNEHGQYVPRTASFGNRLHGASLAQVAKEASRDFLGFGLAITGSSCWNLNLMETEDRRSLLRKLYTEEGLNMSIARLTVGSSDYSAEVYSYDDVPDDLSLKHFSIDRDREYIIPMIKEILAVKPDLYLFASPWSPPGWMKTGGSMGGGYMREKYLDCYAKYYVKFLQAYAEEGITIRALTPQNEAESHQNGRMPACIWHPDIMAKFIRILRQKLDEHGLDVEIWGYDHNFTGIARVDWSLQEYPHLRRDLTGLAFHYYEWSIEQTRFFREKYPELKLHFTEGGPHLLDHYSEDWSKWALMIMKALACGYSSFTGWNLMLDETGGPNIGPFDCGGFITRDTQTGNLSDSGQKLAFRHFTHIRPESVIRPLVFERTAQCMKQFYRPSPYQTEGCLVENPDETVLILVNPGQKREQVQYEINGQWLYVEMLPNTVATVILTA